MKKVILTLAAASLIGLVACSDKEEKKAPEQNDTKETDVAQEEKKEVNIKAEALDFQMAVTGAINEHDSDIYIFEARKANPDSTDADIAETFEAAKASAEKVAEALKAIDVPNTFGDHEDTMQAFLDKLIASYEKRAEELSTESGSTTTEANGLFKEAEEAINGFYTEVGLLETNLEKEIAG